MSEVFNELVSKFKNADINHAHTCFFNSVDSFYSISYSVICLDYNDSTKRISQIVKYFDKKSIHDTNFQILIINNNVGSSERNKDKLLNFFNYIFDHQLDKIALVWVGNPFILIPKKISSRVSEMFYVGKNIDESKFGSFMKHFYIELSNAKKNIFDLMTAKMNFQQPKASVMVHKSTEKYNYAIQKILQITNSIHGDIDDKIVQASCQSIYKKLEIVSNRQSNIEKNSFFYINGGIHPGTKRRLTLMIVHFDNKFRLNELFFRMLIHIKQYKLPLVIIDWSQNSSQSQLYQKDFINLKHYVFSLKQPVFYILLGCVSIDPFISSSVSNFIFAHSSAVLYIKKKNQYLSAKEAHKINLIDDIFCGDYIQLCNFEGISADYLKEKIVKKILDYEHTKSNNQKERMIRHFDSISRYHKIIK